MTQGAGYPIGVRPPFEELMRGMIAPGALSGMSTGMPAPASPSGGMGIPDMGGMLDMADLADQVFQKLPGMFETSAKAKREAGHGEMRKAINQPMPQRKPLLSKNELVRGLGLIALGKLLGIDDSELAGFGKGFLGARKQTQDQAVEEEMAKRGMNADLAKINAQEYFQDADLLMSQSSAMMGQQQDTAKFEREADLKREIEQMGNQSALAVKQLERDSMEKMLGVKEGGLTERALLTAIRQYRGDPVQKAEFMQALRDMNPVKWQNFTDEDIEAQASRSTAGETLDLAKTRQLSASANVLIQQLATAKLIDPLKIKEITAKINLLPEKLQLDLLATRALIGQRRESARLNKVKADAGGFAPPKAATSLQEQKEQRLLLQAREGEIKRQIQQVAPWMSVSGIKFQDIPEKGSKDVIDLGSGPVNRYEAYQQLVGALKTINEGYAALGAASKSIGSDSSAQAIKDRLGIKY